jgi:hypothetical protein
MMTAGVTMAMASNLALSLCHLEMCGISKPEKERDGRSMKYPPVYRKYPEYFHSTSPANARHNTPG